MQIEEGKYYRTRDGRKVGPMIFDDDKFWDGGKTKVGNLIGIWLQDGKADFFTYEEPSHRIYDLIAEWKDEPMVKLEVGKKYELNNGKVVTCTEMYGDDLSRVDHLGYGPFVVGGRLYHQDGRFANRDASHEFSVKREISQSQDNDPRQPPTLSTTTIDAIAIDSLKFHYATEMEPLQKEAFRIVLRYYGVSA